MKRLAYLAVSFIAAITLAPSAVTVFANTDDGLPQLHKIRTVSLVPRFGCPDRREVRPAPGLYVSSYSEESKRPELVFEGFCKSADYFSGATAGDDMSLVADLGDIRLEDVSAHLAFNPKNMVSHDAYFSQHVPVADGHTYALVINKSEYRGLVVFHVDDYQPNKSVKLRYAVKEYQLMVARKSAEGFNWTGKNSE
jgi:hypothetical protein